MENLSSQTLVLERFSNRSEQISQLLQKDANFVEICSNYEELSCWLATHDHEVCPPESACAMNRLLLAELEVEILHYLQATGSHSAAR